MPNRFRTHLRSNLVGYLALVVALSGTAWAATAPPKNSVTSKSIKKGAVKGPKIAPNAVTGPKVRDGSLTRADLDVAGLGTVPNSAHADTADSAAQAANATHAANADNAANAGNAAQLGGSPAGSFLKGTDAIPGGDLTGAYAEPRLAANSVAGSEVANASLAGADVQPNSLTGSQIDEATLNGVDADTFGAKTPSGYVQAEGGSIIENAFAIIQSDDSPANTIVIRNLTWELQTTGTPHVFKICTRTYDATQRFVIVANGTRTTQSLGLLDCGTTFSTGGSGTTVPGDFTIFGPSMVMFGGPHSSSNGDTSTELYNVVGIGRSLAVGGG